MNDHIIKILNLEDTDLIIEGPVIYNGKKVLTLTKKLAPTFCPICGIRTRSKGIYTRTVNHPVSQDGTQLILKLNLRRWGCINPVRGHSRNDTFIFVDSRRGNTNLGDISIVMAFKDAQLSAAQIAKRFSVSDTYAIQLFARYVDLPRRQLSEVIRVDEVHVNISKVCNYALVLQDFLTGEPIDLVANRRQEITEPYFASIPKAERFRVKYLISDMYRPYISYVDKYFPNAISIVDSIHVVKMINEKILGYIRRPQNKYKHLDEQRHERLEQQLGRKLEFTHSKEMRKHPRELIELYQNCPYSVFHDVADTLSYYFESIVNSFIMVERMCADGSHISRLSNGPMESLNRIAKDMKRNGHGYSNFDHLRNRFLFSQRKSARILATPLPLEAACPETGIKRGKYHKQKD